MAVTKNEIQCDNHEICKSVRPRAGSLEFSFESARVHGWKIWTGFTMGGELISAILCDKCVGTARSRPLRSAPPLQGDQTLF